MGETDSSIDINIFTDHLSKPCRPNSGPGIVMGPVTPIPDRETQVLCSPSGHFKDADGESVCQTPPGSKFDPFAPGREELMFAPKKKLMKKTYPPSRRQLDFDSFDLKESLVDKSVEEKLEENFLETTYRSFLDIIIPVRIRSTEIVGRSDVTGPSTTEGMYDPWRERLHLSETYLSKVVISDVGDVAFSESVDNVTGPPTPVSERKNRPPSSPSGQSDELDSGSDCRTPRWGTFDPFAPAPEGSMMLAPKKKLPNGMYAPVQRKLNFDVWPCQEKLVVHDSMETSGEEIMLATLYNSLLDEIISHQIGESVGESSIACSAAVNGLKTPASSTWLNGIAETCPGAPLRPSSISRKFNMNICRKLEF